MGDAQPARDADAAATTEAFLASLEAGAAAPAAPAATGGEEQKRKRKRWGDKVEEPAAAQEAPLPGGTTPAILAALTLSA